MDVLRTSGHSLQVEPGRLSYGQDYSLDKEEHKDSSILEFMYMGSRTETSRQGLGTIRKSIYKCLSPFGTVSKMLADLAVLRMAREGFN